MTLACALHAQAGDPWDKLQFLLGNWIGVAGPKDTELGAGQGSFSFEPQLNRKIIVRRNRARYDSGASHGDLMIVYLEGSPKAMYFDSEGHVIRYTLTFPSSNHVIFESEAGQAGPRSRLSYWLDGAALKGRFETAESPSAYKTYLQWTSTSADRVSSA